ncbi:MAG: sigma-70 family RNA polymerase sigma factor, partial [Alloacidobacterium sp.]
MQTRIARAARNLPVPKKDLSVTVTVRNNKLRERREKLGLSQKELARAAGLNGSYYTGLETLRLPAQRLVRHSVCRAPNCNNTISRKEQLCIDCLVAYGTDPAGWALDQWPEKVYWVAPALKLAKFFGCSVEDLFPPATAAVKNRRVTVAVNAEDMEKAIEVIQLAAIPKSERLALPSPEQEVIDADFKNQVAKALATLSLREERIIRTRFGFDGAEKTLSEVGEDEGVSRERIRGIEVKALRRLRMPARANRLKGFHSGYAQACPTCSKRAGYRCETGTWFCGYHVRPLDACSCELCAARREQIVKREEYEAR